MLVLHLVYWSHTLVCCSEMIALLRVIHFTFLCSCHRHSRVNVCSDFLKRKYLWRSPRCAECPQVVLRTSFWRGLSFCCHNSTAACSCGPLISSAFLQNQYHSPFCFLFSHQCDGLEIKGLYTWHGKFRKKGSYPELPPPSSCGGFKLKNRPPLSLTSSISAFHVLYLTERYLWGDNSVGYGNMLSRALPLGCNTQCLYMMIAFKQHFCFSLKEIDNWYCYRYD